MEKLFTEFDADRNQKIDFDEFVRMVTPRNIEVEQEVIDCVKGDISER